MRKLAIIGLGLMGGSLGLAARKKRVARSVVGYARREETRAEALKHRVVDQVFDRPEDAVKDADMVVFCLPVLAIPEVAEKCIPSFADDCVVTDVGSTKMELVTEMEKLLKKSKAVFVGSHPIAGSDETGLSAAKVDLYDKAAVIITPRHGVINKEVSKVRRMWEDAGSRVFLMDPKDHDTTIARTSHLPHLVASSLVNAVWRVGKDAGRFCGTGFRDATRIAAGSEDMWHDIVKSNRRAVVNEMKEFGKIIARLTSMIEKDDFNGVRHFLSDNRAKRMEFEEQFKRERRL